MTPKRFPLTLGIAVCLHGLLGVGGVAQQVDLFLVDGGNLGPVSGATVSLLTPEDRSVWSGSSDALGQVGFSAPAGEYYLVAIGLGFEPYRSPLLEIPPEGTYTLEIPLDRAPVAVEGITVTARSQATELLTGFGLSVNSIGRRWIDRSEIEQVMAPFHIGDVLRGQNLPGLTVDEPSNPQDASLCVRVGKACTLLVLEGVIVSADHAYMLNPDDLGAIAVLKPGEATLLYGIRGVNGAVIMWLGRGVS